VAAIVAALFAYREWRGPDLGPRGSASSRRRALPSFELQGLTGTQTVDLKDLKGQVVLINFWGVWCHPVGLNCLTWWNFTRSFRRGMISACCRFLCVSGLGDRTTR